MVSFSFKGAAKGAVKGLWRKARLAYANHERTRQLPLHVIPRLQEKFASDLDVARTKRVRTAAEGAALSVPAKEVFRKPHKRSPENKALYVKYLRATREHFETLETAAKNDGALPYDIESIQKAKAEIDKELQRRAFRGL